jgi:hypothetical protein
LREVRGARRAAGGRAAAEAACAGISTRQFKLATLVAGFRETIIQLAEVSPCSPAVKLGVSVPIPVARANISRSELYRAIITTMKTTAVAAAAADYFNDIAALRMDRSKAS